MSKVAVVYWSGTGNTEQMAYAVAEGVTANHAEADVLGSSEFDPSMIENYDAIAFGCPAMGAEVLEEEEFEPLFNRCIPLLSGKKIALFGSFGWGDGEWMRSWEAACGSAGVPLVCESVICNYAPDESALDECKRLGASLL